MVAEIRAATIFIMTAMAALQVQRGGESDDLFHDLGGLLLDLFRGGLLLQFLFVPVRGRAHGPAAPAAFPWACRRRTFAFGQCSGGTWAGHGRSRAGCRERDSG